MKKFLLVFLISTVAVFAQQENVPLDNDVYFFLKEMNVKGLIQRTHDDSPNMSRYEVGKFLETIDEHKSELSETESKLLKKFQVEFCEKVADSTNTYQMFGEAAGYRGITTDLLSDKIKYTYVYREPEMNFYLNILGRALYGHTFQPGTNNTELFDIGFRFRGTLFNKLAYSLTVQKGGVSGSEDVAPLFDPRLLYNFKYVEAIENIGNYDFAEGYLRYYTEPIKEMKLALQIGREKIKFGYGYGSKLVLSGDHPYLDFFRLNFDYGIFSFTSITASTVGTYDKIRNLNYTKYLAINRFKLNFPKLFEFGLGENIIYSGRGLDLAYMNPMVFYKFVEMSLQDRDNGTLWLDFQTHCFKNFEITGTFFLDEDILSNLQDLSLFKNKTAYQVGAMWYTPFSVSNLSLFLEYTKIRPYVYTHDNDKNSYTASGLVLGHNIGPNADELLLRGSYNLNEKIRLTLDYQFVRSGENVYDRNGQLLFNAGGDPLVPYRFLIDPEHINFLDGIRFNQNIVTANVRIEPIRNYYFDITYKYISLKNVRSNSTANTSYTALRLLFEI